MLPSRSSLKGINIFSSSSSSSSSLFFFFEREWLLRGIVYPVAVKARSVLDLVHREKSRKTCYATGVVFESCLIRFFQILYAA